MSKSLENVLARVAHERETQDGQWGVQNHHPAMWIAILTEEVGEVAKEVQEMYFSGKGAENYLVELKQVAAVAVAAIESFERQNPR